MIAVGASLADKNATALLDVGDREQRVHDTGPQIEVTGKAPEMAQPVRVRHQMGRCRQERDMDMAELGQAADGQLDSGGVVRADPGDSLDAIGRRVQRNHWCTRTQVLPEPY